MATDLYSAQHPQTVCLLHFSDLTNPESDGSFAAGGFGSNWKISGSPYTSHDLNFKTGVGVHIPDGSYIHLTNAVYKTTGEAFTIEFWGNISGSSYREGKVDTNGANPTMLSLYADSVKRVQIHATATGAKTVSNSSGHVSFYARTNSASGATGTTIATNGSQYLNSLHHYLLVCGGNFRWMLFIDGKFIGQEKNTNAGMPGGSLTLSLGDNPSSSKAVHFVGDISELRIIRGIPIYYSNKDFDTSELFVGAYTKSSNMNPYKFRTIMKSFGGIATLYDACGRYWHNEGLSYEQGGKFNPYAIKSWGNNLGAYCKDLMETLSWMDAFTISFWSKKPSDVNTWNYILMFGKDADLSIQNRDASFNSGIGMRIDGNSYDLASSEPQPVGEWVHIVIMHLGANDDDKTNKLRLYINGRHVASTSVFFNYTYSLSLNNLYLGYSGQGANYAGLIDDLVIVRTQNIWDPDSDFEVPIVPCTIDPETSFRYIGLSVSKTGIINSSTEYNWGQVINAGNHIVNSESIDTSNSSRGGRETPINPYVLKSVPWSSGSADKFYGYETFAFPYTISSNEDWAFSLWVNPVFGSTVSTSPFYIITLYSAQFCINQSSSDTDTANISITFNRSEYDVLLASEANGNEISSERYQSADLIISKSWNHIIIEKHNGKLYVYINGYYAPNILHSSSYDDPCSSSFASLQFSVSHGNSIRCLYSYRSDSNPTYVDDFLFQVGKGIVNYDGTPSSSDKIFDLPTVAYTPDTNNYDDQPVVYDFNGLHIL